MANFLVGEDGSGTKVGEDGSGTKVGEDGSGTKVGEDGTGGKNTDYCKMLFSENTYL